MKGRQSRSSVRLKIIFLAHCSSHGQVIRMDWSRRSTATRLSNAFAERAILARVCGSFSFCYMTLSPCLLLIPLPLEAILLNYVFNAPLRSSQQVSKECVSYVCDSLFATGCTNV